ncbi:Mur ligase [Auricularia subglabra TFB-10046 SS5]|uniref:Mur ligase n=1 Tax=Auricularia subglabra (strain TFB-10046 / SS5) TaxID=717982 RepID=J0WWR3_AURST|nr:Mur ligase [Auricularia subglabra TFB-10046 SS5]
MDLTLSRIKRLIGLLPTYARPTIHVAGTNGKGSTTAILSSIFVASNITSGRFNSPHLLNEWDCISLNGAPISETFYREVRDKVERVNDEHDIRASNFEILTAVAMQVFEHVRVDVAIFEVGMGGRLDATNALPDDCIVLSAITAIELDHQAWLGHTLEQIAREKAGIARPKKVCVVGESITGSVKAAIKEVLDAAKADMISASPCDKRPWDDQVDGPSPPPFSFQPRFVPPPPQPVQVTQPMAQMSVKAVLSMQGDHQRQNLATALGIVTALLQHASTTQYRITIANRIIQASIVSGIKLARMYGRLHWVHLLCPQLSPTVSPRAHRLNHNLNLNPTLQLDLTLLIDGAHNRAGCAALNAYLDSLRLSDRRYIILSMSHQPDKDPLETLTPLLRRGDNVAIVPFSPVDGMPWVRPIAPRELSSVVRRLVGSEGSLWCCNAGGEDAAEWEQLAPGEYPRRQLARALRWISERSKVAVLAGSLYLAADMYRLLKDTPPKQ